MTGRKSSMLEGGNYQPSDRDSISASSEHIAIVGSGIAGLACAYFLRNSAHVTVFEASSRIGGHVNTILVEDKYGEHCIDTGFMVFNKLTYPGFTELIERLSVKIEPTDMSFSVNHVPLEIEWSGTGLRRFFARKRNFINPLFWSLIAGIADFNRKCLHELKGGTKTSLSLENFAVEKNISPRVLELYLLPMMSSLWSAQTSAMREFPAAMLIRFMHTHGLLSIYGKLDWFTIAGGARQYIDKLISGFKDNIELNSPVSRIEPSGEKIALTIAGKEVRTFDRCILASHADQSYSMLSDEFAEEKKLLSVFEYRKNSAIVHTDERVMPREKANWASWNYRIDEISPKKNPQSNANMQATIKKREFKSSTQYWMNSLQNISSGINYFVSIDNQINLPQESIIEKIEYSHPLFNLETLRAQKKLIEIDNSPSAGNLHLCGSYFGFGFHEDAFSSALRLCKSLLGRSPWN